MTAFVPFQNGPCADWIPVYLFLKREKTHLKMPLAMIGLRGCRLDRYSPSASNSRWTFHPGFGGRTWTAGNMATTLPPPLGHHAAFVATNRLCGYQPIGLFDSQELPGGKKSSLKSSRNWIFQPRAGAVSKQLGFGPPDAEIFL